MGIFFAKNMKKKIKIYSLGCKVNQYDSSCLRDFLVSTGFIPVQQKADIVVINTCAVTKKAISKNKRMVNKARQENKNAIVFLSGCWPRVYSSQAQEVGADMVFLEKDMKNLAKKILNFLNNKNKINDIHYSPINDRCRYFLKVQDGCEQFCSYCIIPYTRGRLYSRLQENIIKEAKIAVKKGFKEIVLSGIHLGLFGINNIDKKQEENTNLAKLLQKILYEIPNLPRIRLSSIEITEVDKELIDLIAREERICNHLHISLQSGCDKTLQAMNRPYTTKYFANKLKEIKKEVFDIAISTDVIVGFPGEDEKDFQATKDFLKNMKFSRLHVFSFSAHEKTPAWKMEPKIDKETIKKRSFLLRDLDVELQTKFRNKFLGKKQRILIEYAKDGWIKGKTQYYFDVWAKKDKIFSQTNINDEQLVGQIVELLID